jgi:hypothetical protein
MRTILKGTLLAALAVAAVVPASADYYKGSFQQVHGVTMSGTIQVDAVRTAKVTVTLRQVEGNAFTGDLKVLPPPNHHSLADDAAGTEPIHTTYVGCITIKIGAMKDKGCKILGPAITLDMDPALNEGTVIFSVESSKYEKRKLYATLLLTGTGNPTPTTTPGAPTVTPGPPMNNKVSMDGLMVISRAMDVTSGSVRSESIGGGPVISTAKASMFEGLGVGLEISTACPVSATGRCIV